MTPIFRRLFLIFPAALLLAALTGCGNKTTEVPATTPTALPVQATEPTEDPITLVEDLKVVLKAGELYTLNLYPNLKTVDLSGSTCYDAIVQFMQSHPNLAITYSVDLGGTEVDCRADSITLEPGSFSYDLLLENLQYLPDLTAISLPDLNLTADQVAALRETYPQLELNYTVELFGVSYDLSTDSLDLSSMSQDQVSEAAQKLGLLPNLSHVQLSNFLDMASVAKLQDAAPWALFEYSFQLFGKALSTAAETVEYKNQDIGNEGVDQLREALAILRNCRRFVLDNCKIDFELLAQLREEFRGQTNLVWRIYFGDNYRYNALTDDEVIRAVYHVSDENVSALKYCEGAKYIDMGHNDYLTDLSFASGMPNLEAFIGSGSAVKELTGFENCKKLYWLELANCNKLQNIDALAGCESLGYLNISYSKVTSFLALDGLPLERFVYMNPKASTKEQNTFVAIHEDCRTVYYGYNNPWTPWRYDDNGKTFNQYYKDVVRVAFNYDYLEQFLPKD